MESLSAHIESSPANIEEELSERERALLRLARRIAEVVDRLQAEVTSEGLYDITATSAALRHPLTLEGG